MNSEEWRPVVTQPGRYEVSSLGRVRVLEHIQKKVMRGLNYYFRRPMKILQEAIGGRAKNYKRVRLHNPERHAYVHHLVAESFIGPRPKGLLVLHEDDNGFHNTKDNIRYGDRDENEADRHVAAVAPGLEDSPF